MSESYPSLSENLDTYPPASYVYLTGPRLLENRLIIQNCTVQKYHHMGFKS